MSNAPVMLRQGPSLRIEELAITNFRTFRERTVIPFRGGAPDADALATFHGPNGSGKSNALAALDLFFVVALYCIKDASSGFTLLWDQELPPYPGMRTFSVRYRDRPNGAEGPTEIEVKFVDARLGILRVLLTPSGDRVHIQCQTNHPHLVVLRDLIKWIQTPSDSGTHLFAILNARRRASWLAPEPHGHGTALVEELFNHRTSLRVEIRERWRAFVRVLERFPMFQGKEISVDRIQANEPPVLSLEERGRSVLRLDELSSGEQQIVLLCAAILVANAPIVAIEEPELSLDASNAQLLRGLLEEQIKAGLVDQIILESHVPAFDSASVIRFQRGPDGATLVAREKAASEDALELSRKAKEHGAEPQWVTGEGYTQIPDIMRKDLEVGAGKHVWFLKGPERWEVWPEEELDQMLGGRSGAKDG